MAYQIKDLEIRENGLFKFLNSSTESHSNFISSLSKLNIFVAPNNSGKSRFIRSILWQDPGGYMYLPNNVDIEALNGKVNEMKNEVSSYLSSIRFSAENLPNVVLGIPEIKILTEGKSDFFVKFGSLTSLLSKLSTQSASQNGISFQQCSSAVTDIISKYKSKLPQKDEIEQNFERIYIPMLRGLRPLSGTDDIYSGNTSSSYWPNQETGHFKIITGLEFNRIIRDHLLGKYEERLLIHDYEKFLSETFFDSKDVSLIPSKNDDGILQIKIGEEPQRAIHDLGDGIQSIIIVTLPLFLRKKRKLLIFIEEPEHCLHPGAQRKLIDTLIKQEGFEDFQYFITTHSNHLLDITQDFENISIFSISKEFGQEEKLEKDAKFVIENLQSGNQKILHSLGTTNSSVFLTNSTVWVEGITDRMYIRHYLNLYQKELIKRKEIKPGETIREDIHFSFVEYSGSNIIHWTENESDAQSINVKRMTGKMFLVADRDEGIGKLKRRKKMREMLGDRYYPLSVREIENLLLPSVLKNIIAKYEKTNVDNIPNPVYGGYKSEYLGNYINNLLGSDIKRVGGYASESGTIKGKNKFCKLAIDNIQDWSHVSTDAKNLTEKIFEFIRSQNP